MGFTQREEPMMRNVTQVTNAEKLEEIVDMGAKGEEVEGRAGIKGKRE